jgi:hypothetical protein
MAQEQPSAKALFDGMQTVTDGRLRYLHNERLRIAQQSLLKQTAARKFPLEHSCGYFESIPADLHHSPIGCSIASEEQGDTDNSIISCESHLGGRTISRRVEP